MKILVVATQPIFRLGLRSLVATLPGFSICAEADSIESAKTSIRTTRPDIVLTELSRPGSKEIKLIRWIRSEEPSLLVVVLSEHEEPLPVALSLRAGASAYVSKADPFERVADALHKVLAGERYVSARYQKDPIVESILSKTSKFTAALGRLTDRELEVFELIGRGESTIAIAEKLNLSVKTVETHRMHIKTKFEINDADDLTRLATGWVECLLFDHGGDSGPTSGS